MRLTPDEYRRGLVSWEIDSKAEIWTETMSRSGLTSGWCGPLTDPTGSVARTPRLDTGRVRIRADDQTALCRPWVLRWEQLQEPGVITRIYENDVALPVATLTFVPNYGTFHRLVVACPLLAWAQDLVLRTGDIVVRLHSGTIRGERVTPADGVEWIDGRPSVVGGGEETVTAEGRFIEIIAPGTTPDAAEFLARTLWGLVSLVCGEQAAGDVVFSETHVAGRGDHRVTVHIPVLAAFPHQVTDAELDALDRGFARVGQTTRLERAVSRALAWQLRAIKASDKADELLSWFIGIETIITAYAADHGPVPEERERQLTLLPLIQTVLADLDSETRSRLTQKFLDPSLRERFRFYADRHGWDQPTVGTFGKIADVRSAIVHGNPVAVDPKQVGDARRLLVEMLKAELCLQGAFGWEALPGLDALEFTFRFAPVTNG